MLHIVNKSPFQSTSLQTCLRLAKPGSAVLLIEDGVYGATVGTSVETMVRQAASGIKFYALQPDVDARGATGKVMDGITLVDYSGFVDLTLEYSTSHSWL
ncbi:MAG: sulfurtransferase complex subunit TusB [Rhodoferax sp.]|uniref:sulfurtransferase complex subunit TusB n=1 Tax=Rhodoferax sp. TaxID=50421 RepID=UPI001B47B58F|nr:sulfurtransferase complex subunit TusB [Rhodoferax sp.]MBP9905067.1 sulfurtransferase complex subunit TusB [Rhodoferax sp.]